MLSTVEGFRSELLPWQRRFVRRALAPGTDTAALTIARGNGKSSLAAWIGARALTPGDPLFRAGSESHMIAASVGQSRRTTFKLLRRYFDERGDWRVAESVNNAHVLHKPTNTRLSVLAANPKTAQGLVSVPLAILDEPGAFEVVGGAAVWDAVRTAQGKPDSDMLTVLIGTLAPHGVPGNWWHNLVRAGTRGTTYVQAVEGDAKRWRDARAIRKANPLMWRFPKSRAKLLEERDEAIADTRLRAAFTSYRLNCPSRDESAVVLTVEDWELATSRPVPEPEGQPFVGIDLGGGRAWSAAVAVWPNGRTEAVAVAPGIPDIAEQERRDRVSAGTYQRLVDAGTLHVATGLRVQPPAALADLVVPWRPRVVICDRFRLPELQDAARLPYFPRVTRYSESAQDIRAARKAARDGPLSVASGSRSLLQASLAVATVKNDDQGSYRIEKSSNNTARDDVAQALVLAASARSRMPARTGGAYGGAV